MLKAGSAILALWSLLNLVPSLFILVDTLLLGGHTPALSALLADAEIESLSSGTLATLDSIAIFANGTNAAFSVLALCMIWFGLLRNKRWAIWSLLAAYTIALFAGVAADAVVGFANPMINVISGGILSFGLALAAAGLFRANR